MQENVEQCLGPDDVQSQCCTSLPDSEPEEEKDRHVTALPGAEGPSRPSSNESSPGGGPDWVALVRRIHAGEAGGMEQLYSIFSRGIRYYLCRQLGPQDLDDKVHDTFLIVVQAIRRGELRSPERLMGFVRTVVRRQVAAHIDHCVQIRREQTDLETGFAVWDRHNNPEEDAIARQRREIMTNVLRSVSRRDRDILTRFYLLGESQEQICAEMGLSETQFRLLKSRAKARFGELGKRRLDRNRLTSIFLRTNGGEAD
ncbi:MAG: sigma-70 family RNA polymerase sigma factor [Bryobacteraceae bacterium]|jgi:RNA polymerase sigma factor (sigma-70 family)